MWDNILNGAAWLLYQLAKLVGDWGLAIIIVTLVIRLILFPLQRSQNMSNFKMQQLQPKLLEIQQKYAGDQEKISEETMKVYQQTGFNPMAGCLPMLIQLPIFIILFQVLRNKLGNFTGGELAVSFYNIIPDLTISMSTALNTEGIRYALPYILFFVFFVIMSIAPSIMSLLQSTSQQSKTTSIMMLVMMVILFIWMGWISPGGVLLYWSLSSAFGFFQQIITKKNLEKEKAKIEEETLVKPVEVSVERRTKKKRPHKKR